MEDNANKTFMQTQELHSEVKAVVEEIKMKIYDF